MTKDVLISIGWASQENETKIGCSVVLMFL